MPISSAFVTHLWALGEVNLGSHTLVGDGLGPVTWNTQCFWPAEMFAIDMMDLARTVGGAYLILAMLSSRDDMLSPGACPVISSHRNIISRMLMQCSSPRECAVGGPDMRVLLLEVGPNVNFDVPVGALIVDAFASRITMLLSYGIARLALPIMPVPCELGKFFPCALLALEAVVLVSPFRLEALVSLVFISALVSAALMAW
jgi:hypothetical protein